MIPGFADALRVLLTTLGAQLGIASATTDSAVRLPTVTAVVFLIEAAVAVWRHRKGRPTPAEVADLGEKFSALLRSAGQAPKPPAPPAPPGASSP